MSTSALLRFVAPGFAAVASTLSLASTPGSGTICTLENLATEAGVIGEFQVESQHTAFAELTLYGGGARVRAIFTFVSFRVNEVLKGRIEGSTITLRFPGGEYDGVSATITVGTPIFENGERVILFLDSERDDESLLFPVLRAEWGKFSIETEPETGRQYVANAWGRKVTGIDPETGLFMTVPGPPKAGTTRYIGRNTVAARDPATDWRMIDPGPEPSQAALQDPLSPQAFGDLIRELVSKATERQGQ